MKALLRALAAAPEARVRTVRMTHDGDVHEEVSGPLRGRSLWLSPSATAPG